MEIKQYEEYQNFLKVLNDYRDDDRNRKISFGVDEYISGYIHLFYPHVKNEQILKNFLLYLNRKGFKITEGALVNNIDKKLLRINEEAEYQTFLQEFQNENGKSCGTIFLRFYLFLKEHDNSDNYLKFFKKMLSSRGYGPKMSDKEIKRHLNQIDLSYKIIHEDYYNYIKNYVKTYEKSQDPANINNLLKVLQTDGFKGGINDLQYLVNRERKSQYRETQFQILSLQWSMNNANTLEEYLANYLLFSKLAESCYLDYFDMFHEFLRRKNIELTKIDLLKALESLKQKEFEYSLKNPHTGNPITIEHIDKISGTDFERILGKLFEKKGYMIQFTPITGDQGADIIAKGFGEIVAIQAKKYSGRVGNSAIQEVVSSIRFYNADRGLVATNTNYTRSAIELAKSNNIELWDREDLTRHLNALNISHEEIQRGSIFD